MSRKSLPLPATTFPSDSFVRFANFRLVGYYVRTRSGDGILKSIVPRHSVRAHLRFRMHSHSSRAPTSPHIAGPAPHARSHAFSEPPRKPLAPPMYPPSHKRPPHRHPATAASPDTSYGAGTTPPTVPPARMYAQT